jgi:hypothetical protein
LTEIKKLTETIEKGDMAKAKTPTPATEAVGAWGSEADSGFETLPNSVKIRKRIGYTIYEVEACFNPASWETLGDKIMRLVRGEAMKKGGGP